MKIFFNFGFLDGMDHYKNSMPMFLIFIVDSSIQGTIVNSYILVCPSTNKADYFYVCRIVLMWWDRRFMNSNITDEEAKMCYPGIVRADQAEDMWKPDIFIDGTIDGVN